ncbi:E3 ubiquitin-protein ligase [Astathelohania contejeani]|uniref:E3 ubiquitin-protein ligase n=1 Tax=Astathelohania contejeani TaxID=164912 RepID=A0ABQ7HV77_9MICR|nr:E3 ubiquitin-protein ligase [Thelohania contejeani]
MRTQRITRVLDRLSALQCIKWLIIFGILFKISQVIANATVLFLTRNQICKAPLKLFLGVYTGLIIIQGILFFMKNREYFSIERIPDIQDNNEVGLFNNFVDAFTFFWYLTGFHWTQECRTCKITNPLLYYTSMLWIYYGVVIIVSPLIAIVALILLITYVRPKLPVVEYTTTSEDIPVQDANCSICLSDYTPQEKIKLLPCQHHFHQACIDEWFNVDDICPLCKKPINLLYDLVEQP